eukprot:scaffold24429_cov84-Amphora_coffeaeformis.AAC.1
MRESPRCLTIKQGPDGKESDNLLQHTAGLFPNSTILPQGSLLISNPPSGKISDWPRYEEGE